MIMCSSLLGERFLNFAVCPGFINLTRLSVLWCCKKKTWRKCSENKRRPKLKPDGFKSFQGMKISIFTLKTEWSFPGFLFSFMAVFVAGVASQAVVWGRLYWVSLQEKGVLVLFVCAVVREGSGLLPGRHSWRTSSGGKWAQVHFLKCVLISSAWEAGNFTPGVSAQPLSLYKVKPLLVSLMFGTPCT